MLMSFIAILRWVLLTLLLVKCFVGGIRRCGVYGWRNHCGSMDGWMG